MPDRLHFSSLRYCYYPHFTDQNIEDELCYRIFKNKTPNTLPSDPAVILPLLSWIFHLIKYSQNISISYFNVEDTFSDGVFL